MLRQVCGLVQYGAGCGGEHRQKQASAERRVKRAAARERCRAAQRLHANVCKGRARLKIGMRAGLSHHLHLHLGTLPKFPRCGAAL